MALTASERKRLLGHGGITRVAKRAARDKSHVSRVVAGTRRDPVVERHVAKRLGLPVEEVFAPELPQLQAGAA